MRIHRITLFNCELFNPLYPTLGDDVKIVRNYKGEQEEDRNPLDPSIMFTLKVIQGLTRTMNKSSAAKKASCGLKPLIFIDM